MNGRNQNPRSQLLQIASSLKRLRLSRAAASNLQSDLDALQLRLQSGQYNDTDFMSRNVFDIPRRTREYFQYFEGYMRQAETWAAVFRKLPLHRSTTVVDLCPGWGPKIEMGLCLVGFQGKVCVVDTDAHALQQAAQFLKIFKPRYALRLQKQDFYSSKPSKGNLVIGNHILDDLLLSYFCKQQHISLETLYGSESKFKATVEKIATESSTLDSYLEKLIQGLESRLLPGGILAMTHYPGLHERSLGLKLWTACTRSLFRRLQECLKEKGYRDLSAPARRALTTVPKPYFRPNQFFALQNPR